MRPSADDVAQVAALRAASAARAAARPRGPELAVVRDETGPEGLALRRYRPALDPRPLVVFAHGGGFFLGDLDTHDLLCRRLARAADVEVLAVGYRRAPETPWPGAIDDVAAVVRRTRPRAVAGDSAGGYLVTAACLALRDAGDPLPALQVLVCPNTDLTLTATSIDAFGSGWSLDRDFLELAVRVWTPDPADRAPASPLHAASLAGLPAAVVVTAEHDALRDEGEAYARRLAAAGVPVRHRREAGLAHGFVQDADPAAVAATERLFADVRAALGR
jgi:acetyl esterase